MIAFNSIDASGIRMTMSDVGEIEIVNFIISIIMMPMALMLLIKLRDSDVVTC